MAELEEYSDDDSLEEHSDGTASMDYSSFEESSHSEIDEDITRNTVRWARMHVYAWLLHKTCCEVQRSVTVYDVGNVLIYSVVFYTYI